MKLYLLWSCFAYAISGVSSKCSQCFPDDFLWGAATSSYQIEGAWNSSDKGENMWDWFTHTYPEKISNGSNGDIAADSYHKYQEDIDLLENLGVSVYRFSLSWTRILPDGTVNNVSEDGVNYYLTILKELQENNIQPLVTIYHWDLPLPLHELGGWTNPEIADYFADYANLCYNLFGDYVKYWATLNEPISTCYYGYGAGVFAPGVTESGTATYQCAYTHLLAHAKAYHIYNETYKATQNGMVAIVLANNWYEPLTDSEEDQTAAENAVQWELGLFAHPIYIGNWPEVVIDRIGNLSIAQGYNESRLPAFTEDEIELINGTHDYMAINYYTTYLASPISNIDSIENTTVTYVVDRNVKITYNSNWTVAADEDSFFDVPEGLRAELNWIANRYGHPDIIITENGYPTAPSSGNNDTARINYIQGHLCNVLKAKYLDGVSIFGYTYWSLINTFEWNNAYDIGLGLVAVDFWSTNRTRTPRESYYYYQNVVTSNCLQNCSMKS